MPPKVMKVRTWVSGTLPWGIEPGRLGFATYEKRPGDGRRPRSRRGAKSKGRRRKAPGVATPCPQVPKGRRHTVARRGGAAIPHTLACASVRGFQDQPLPPTNAIRGRLPGGGARPCSSLSTSRHCPATRSGYGLQMELKARRTCPTWPPGGFRVVAGQCSLPERPCRTLRPDRLERRRGDLPG